MTQKRMLHRDVCDCDNFTEMPHRAQSLYFHFCIHADDDGFVNKVTGLRRSLRGTERDIELLVERGLLFQFSKDLVIIRHWKKHNTIPAKNYRPTLFQEELATLSVDREKIYQRKSEKISSQSRGESGGENTEKEVEREKADATAADGISSEVTSDPCPTTTAQEKEAEKKSPSDSGEVTFQPPTREEVEAYAKAEGLIHVDIGRFFDYYDGSGWRTPKGHPVNWRFKLRSWERDDAKDAKNAEQPSSGSFDTDEFFNAALARSYQSMEGL